MKISLWLTPVLLMIAIVLAIPNVTGAADNVTQNATKTTTPPAAAAESSFMDIFPWYIWLIFGLVFLALIVLIAILLFAPKKKKGAPSGPGDKRQMAQGIGGPQKSGKQMPPQQGGPTRQGVPQQRMAPPNQPDFAC